MTPRRPQAIRLHPELPEPRPIIIGDDDRLPVGAILAIAFGLMLWLVVIVAALMGMLR